MILHNEKAVSSMIQSLAYSFVFYILICRCSVIEQTYVDVESCIVLQSNKCFLNSSCMGACVRKDFSVGHKEQDGFMLIICLSRYFSSKHVTRTLSK